MVLPLPSIQYALQLGYKIAIINGYSFKTCRLMKGMFQSLFVIKSNAKKDNNKALETMAKLLINSGYGWTSLNTARGSRVDFASLNSDKMLKYTNEGRLLDYTQWSNNDVMRV